MPANLTHKYLKVEQAYRRATTLDEELACLQEMLREVPKHKGTDRLQADLKQKIRRAKQGIEQQRQRGVGKPASFRLARVWSGPTHAGNIVKADYVPSDRDVVEFHV